MAEETGSRPRTDNGGGIKVEPDDRRRMPGDGGGKQPVEPVGRRETYRTLGEQRGRLSEAEERFERGRRTVGLFLGMLALPVDMEAKQQTLASILALVVVWWITEAIPIPVAGIIGVSLCVAMGVAEADEVFGSFADPTAAMMLPIALGIMTSVGRLIVGQVDEDRPERLRLRPR